MASIQNDLDAPSTTDDIVAPRAVRWALGVAALLMVGAGALLWLKFGPVIFVDLVTAAVNCF